MNVRTKTPAVLAGLLLSGALMFPAPAVAAPPGDRDGDTLGDLVEIDFTHTDPDKLDTDGDGLNDGVEVNIWKTNPLKLDTDGDGVNDWVEATQNKTDPLKAPQAAPAVPPMAAPNPFRGRVVDDVDLYDVPGGNGNVIGILRKGSYVFPRNPCPAADWCELTTSPPGDSVGWVWGEFLRNEPNR